jgi:hypothetical protein
LPQAFRNYSSLTYLKLKDEEIESFQTGPLNAKGDDVLIEELELSCESFEVEL